MTALEIIEDTVLFYWEDPLGRRAVTDVPMGTLEVTGGCVYLTDDGRMCALGRYLTEHPEAARLENRTAASQMLMDYPAPAIEDVTELYAVQEFWNVLQDLHDKEQTWNNYNSLVGGIQEVVFSLDSRENLAAARAWLDVTFGDVQ